MNELAQFVLGLGVFFIGMQMVGERLRELSGPGFRASVTRFTASRWAGSCLGLVAGALMQSATGVTFILVSMVSSGLITAAAALPVITWTNVGLTALAFLVTFNIHPLVAWALGIAGVTASIARHRGTRQGAGIVVGISLLLFGLQLMSESVGPLKESQWLHSALTATLSSFPLAFVCGFLLALLLQSNTGATLMVITLASGGLIDLEPAVMLIYGTNLGAIVLRVVLSVGMRGTSMQLVRFEDLFCVVSGVLMVALFYIERWTGVPLVLAAVRRASASLSVELALAFLLSNLLPALLLTPLTGLCLRLLERQWPPDAADEAARPKFLSPRSLDDPSTAVDLIPRELARLLESLRTSVRAHREGSDSSPVEDQRAADYETLTKRIDEFAGQLALQSMQRSTAERLNVAREATSVVGYLADSYAQLRRSLRTLRGFAGTDEVRDDVLAALEELIATAAAAADARGTDAIARLREQSRSHSALVERAREACVSEAAGSDGSTEHVAQRTAVLKVLADFELITWTVHRLAKLLEALQKRP